MLYSVITATLNIIWEHRNGVCFEKKEMSEEKAVIKIKEEVFTWVQSRANKFVIDRSKWLNSPLMAVM